MNALRRIAAAGGWLAYILNQDSDFNPDVSRRRYPGLILVPVIAGVAFSALAGSQLLVGLVGGTPGPGGFLGWAVIGLTGSALAVLLVVGWLTRFLPFAATGDPVPPLVEGIKTGEEVVVHATGVLQDK